MHPLPNDSPYREEYDLLHALRANPQFLELVSHETGDELRRQTQLRREFPDSLVRGAFALCDLRRRARAKFSRAGQMWFDRRGLEQATAEAVARHKAARFEGSVWDLCCGVGGDAIALAAKCEVSAVDLNPVNCLRTEWNAEVYDCAARVSTVCADVTSLDLGDRLVHIDPDRRAKSAARVVRVEDYVPNLAFLQELTRRCRGGAIKLSPAANFGGKFPGTEIELVSLDGECKEATVWFGSLVGAVPWRATVLPSGETLAGHPLDFAAELQPLQQFLFDPDPAVVRAGLIDAAALQLNLSRLDAEEEYLTGDSSLNSPFVQSFEVLAALSNDLREIRRYFRESNFGSLEIKCRRIPIDIEKVRQKVELPGDEPGVLIFARTAGKAHALVCRRVAPGARS